MNRAASCTVLLAAVAVAALAACGSTPGESAAAATPSPVPTDLAVAAHPFAAALGTAHDAIAGTQAQEAGHAGDLQRLHADVAAELAAVRALDQALNRVPFPADLRGDEVAHLQQALQQAESWLQTAATAASPDAVQAALAVARQAEARAQLSATLIARYIGSGAPTIPSGSGTPAP